MTIERILQDALRGEPLRVINLGLEAFALDLHAAGVPVVHVDWRPPAGGDPRLAALLTALEDDDDPDLEEDTPR